MTPHFGVSVQDADGNTVKTFSYETHENICTAETSETMRYLLEKVVSEGTGKNAKIEGLFHRRKDSNFTDTSKKRP